MKTRDSKYYGEGVEYAQRYIARLPNPGDIVGNHYDMDAHIYTDTLNYEDSDAFWNGWESAIKSARRDYRLATWGV